MNNCSGHRYYSNEEMRDMVNAVTMDHVVSDSKEEPLLSQDMLKKGITMIAAAAGSIGLYYLLEYICWTIF